jgi:predicted methyltransferase
MMMNRRGFALAGSAALALAACGPPAPPQVKPPPKKPAPMGSLLWAVQGPWRIDPERDRYRHPVETLNFFGLRPNMDVVEILPGRGWYTSILAPYLAKGGGKLHVASFNPLTASDSEIATLQEFKDRFMKDPATFGEIDLKIISPKSPPLGPENSADMVLVMRNVHTFMAERYVDKAFRDFFAVLKPGGILGIEEHRGKSTGSQDPQAGDGYVQEAYVKLLAQDAGFDFLGSSEINANPKDTKNHPFGVWTLPPVLRSAPLGHAPDPKFDSAKYKEIGESDRMTLKFRKPGPPVTQPQPTDVKPTKP